jgi:hypothetical protein
MVVDCGVPLGFNVSVNAVVLKDHAVAVFVEDVTEGSTTYGFSS